MHEKGIKVISERKKGKIKKKRKPDTQVIIGPAAPSVRLLIGPRFENVSKRHAAHFNNDLSPFMQSLSLEKSPKWSN